MASPRSNEAQARSKGVALPGAQQSSTRSKHGVATLQATGDVRDGERGLPGEGERVHWCHTTARDPGLSRCASFSAVTAVSIFSCYNREWIFFGRFSDLRRFQSACCCPKRPCGRSFGVVSRRNMAETEGNKQPEMAQPPPMALSQRRRVIGGHSGGIVRLAGGVARRGVESGLMTCCHQDNCDSSGCVVSPCALPSLRAWSALRYIISLLHCVRCAGWCSMVPSTRTKRLPTS